MPAHTAHLSATGFEPQRKPIGIGLALALSMGSFAASAADADLTLKPVVVTGSRVEAQSFDLPYSVDVIDARSIGEAQLKVNVSESLAAVPGLVVQNRQNYAQDLQISSRGFGARAAFGVRGIKLITDGIPASTPDGQGQAATFNLDTAERIEVLRGPFSTVYGAGSGGVIQLFSREGSGAPSIKAGVLGGSWGTTKYAHEAQGEKDGVGYLVNGSRFDTDGFRHHSAASRDQSFAKITLRPDQDSKLNFIAATLHQADTQDPQGITWDTFQVDRRAVESAATDYNVRKNIDNVQGGMNYERRIGAGTLQLSAYVGRRSVLQYQSIPTFVQNIVTRPGQAGGVIDFEREFHGLSARWIHTLAALGGELTLTGGVDYDRSRDDRQGYENFLGSATAPTVIGVRGNLRRDEIDTVTSLDPYLQASWKRGKWGLQAGLRHSHVETEVDDRYLANGDDSGSVSFNKTTPAVGVTYELNPALNLYASAARGYETPTLGEMAYSAGGTGFNLGLKPSTSTQYEFGAKAFVGDYTRLNVAVFQINTDDEIVSAGATGGRTYYTNAASTLRQGLEVAVDSEFSQRWRGKFAFTHMRAVYDASDSGIDDGKRLPAIPATSVYGELAWQPLQGLSTALEAVYRSRVFVNDANDEQVAPSYTLFNLRVAATQTQGPWQFQQMLRLDNLFDRTYVGSVIVNDSNGKFYEPGPGFSAYAGVSARYSF